MRSTSPSMRKHGAIWLVCALLASSLTISGCSTAPRQAASTETEQKTAAPARQSSSADPQEQRRFEAAVALMQKDDVVKAKQSLLALIDQNPGLAGAHINLGIIQLNEGEADQAEASFNTALELKPDSLPAHNQLGVALRMQGKFQEAEQAYRSALQIQPDYLLAHRNLGILYDLYLTKPQLALQHYKRCQSLSASEDKEIGGWILDLERRIKSNKQR
ncbi:MAG: tetratricopeptide repeat protein [Candidatus Thiodiazotropha sp. (ex Ctena orbiculata)]|uniref:Tetratricopeptide repeat protein n=1 Tax=Candidatus Thiodiazotropha taylori TaxID=2792791 RepID=A0A944MAM3_9GAMM|nr:tetratricopeptide repeat protein [Candidatus Thiodiazotropha taylori]MBT2990115.1 tetratricopeptide repeat protein [Candidatus Thiodiazotropha taylori]MBT2997865.1 tetratricopeptide repeat protein [Candidatus Thiodiazotropha taylori]MBT3001653.1 tetratricopeptide repeat protein [Candidatus Thiodiazotropha taylori]MBT3028533.1 tetratricopeptide repeat protein [Candidatus Thiodiazotropha taylori]